MFRVVISAVNFTEGGPLSVLRETLASAITELPSECEIIALVNSVDLINDSRIHFIAIPSAKKSWFKRLYWEWFGFMKISRKIKPSLWLSLHDITPRVVAGRQAVYCHNPSPFYRISLREALMEPSFLAFNFFYAYLYRIFIRRNYCVIVQQNWIRDEFIKKIAKLPIIVAHPSMTGMESLKNSSRGGKFIFIYPALPRIFKNFEILCSAAKLLVSRGVGNFEVRITIDGSENRYAIWLNKRFKDTVEIQFIGRQSKLQMAIQYQEADAVVFPSKLETWGLPITEAKSYQCPILVADLPYARETVGDYDLVSFFPVDSAAKLADLMQSMIEGTWSPIGGKHSDPAPPFASDWAGLWKFLTAGLLNDKQEGVRNTN